VPITSVTKGAEPLRGVGLTNDGAGTHDFSSLAPRVASSTEVIQPSKGWWQLFCLGEGALASRLTGAINVEDDPRGSLSIHQAACLLLFGEWTTEQIFEKQRAQSFDGSLGQSCQEA